MHTHTNGLPGGSTLMDELRRFFKTLFEAEASAVQRSREETPPNPAAASLHTSAGTKTSFSDGLLVFSSFLLTASWCTNKRGEKGERRSPPLPSSSSPQRVDLLFKCLLWPPHPALPPPASQSFRLLRLRSFFHYDFICLQKEEAAGAT